MGRLMAKRIAQILGLPCRVGLRGGPMRDVEIVYYLPDGKPMPYALGDDHLAWARVYESVKGRNAPESNWRVGSTQVGPLWVSTVWLGFDHSFMPGRIEIFETMVFGPGDDIDLTWRYATWLEALLGHTCIVAALRAKRELPGPRLELPA